MSFSGLTGQQELRYLLSRALVGDKLSHANLLTGPSGSGKKSWGKALSQSVLCSNRNGAEPCMQCSSCRSFLRGNNPDFFFIEPEGSRIKIGQIRSVRESFYLRGSRKVCLIDQAEMMTAEASSSMLKILEEPPAGLFFILLAEQPRLLFDTILSRCQHFRLKPLDRTEIIELLEINKNISVEKADLLARITGGLPGYAYQLADDEAFEERFEEAKTLAYNLSSGCDSAHQLLAWAFSLSEREDLIHFLELVCFFFRDGLIQNLCYMGEESVSPKQASMWVESVSPAGLEEAVILINSTIYDMLTTNVNRRLLLEKMLILLQRRLSKCPGLSEFVSGRPEKPTTLNRL